MGYDPLLHLAAEVCICMCGTRLGNDIHTAGRRKDEYAQECRGRGDTPWDLGGLCKVVDTNNIGVKQVQVLHEHGLELRQGDCMLHIRYAYSHTGCLTDLGIPVHVSGVVGQAHEGKCTLYFMSSILRYN